MATRNIAAERDEERALQIIDAIHGGTDDDDDGTAIDTAAAVRMRNAIERAFEAAWRAAREKAKAESRARAARHDLSVVLSGAALRERIMLLEGRLGGQLQLAHRNLAEMSDDDLRTLLADIEELADRKGLLS